jgi:DNA replication and repair protein RecF
LKKLIIKNFRNLFNIELNFDSKINIFVGDNGAGKTNLLEAIYFLGILKSFRTNQDRQLTKFGEKDFFLSGKISKKDTHVEINISFISNKKKVKLNNKPLTKIIDLIGQLRVVIFSPEDLDIVKGTPAIRRRFIDIELAQISPKYLHNLQRYLKILKHRNQILSAIKKNIGVDIKELDAWDDQLVDIGRQIITKRRELIDRLNPLINNIYYKISREQENLKIQYQPCVVEEEFRKILYERREDEINQQVTLFGPHRDDIYFYINDINSRYFASHGQQRTIAVCLKLAELQNIYQQTDEFPILLLDDVTSELDKSRRQALLNFINEDIQVFLTTTDLSELDTNFVKDACIFKIKQGEVIREYG